MTSKQCESDRLRRARKPFKIHFERYVSLKGFQFLDKHFEQLGSNIRTGSETNLVIFKFIEMIWPVLVQEQSKKVVFFKENVTHRLDYVWLEKNPRLSSYIILYNSSLLENLKACIFRPFFKSPQRPGTQNNANKKNRLSNNKLQ